MAGCPRINYRRRAHYATRSNKIKMVRTPGNRLIAQNRTKRSQGTHTPWVLGHKRLAGTKALHHAALRTASHFSKTVSRVYGGVLSHDQVKDRILRAFLTEEQRASRRLQLAQEKRRKLQKAKALKNKKKADRKAAIERKVGVKKAPTKTTKAPKATKAQTKK